MTPLVLQMTVSSDVWLVAASIVLLAIGPLLAHFSRQTRTALAALDSFALITVGGLVLLHVLPHALVEEGWVAAAVALAGFIGPFTVERLGEKMSRAGHHVLVALVAFGFIPHALLDGVALSIEPAEAAAHHGPSLLPFAVVFHRLPVGFAIWWIVRPNQGAAKATAVLATISIATVAGYLLGDSYLGSFQSRGFVLLEALVSGALLHVVVHPPHGSQRGRRVSRWKVPETFGAIAGIAMFALLPGQHGLADGLSGYGASFAEAFVDLALESAPALLLGYLTAGALAVFLPQRSVDWLRRGSSWRQATMGTLYGFPLPICSCGVVPIYRSLIIRGVPATAAMSFLVATPELGVESLLLSFPLLGSELALLRIGCAVIIALAIGGIVGRLIPSTPLTAGPEPAPAETRSWPRRLREVVSIGFGEVLDETAPWIVIGLAVAAAIAPIEIEPYVAGLPPGLDVPLFAFAGIPVYICASGATPLAAVLILKGLSPGAAVALLLTGPATNITTYGVLSRLHGRKAAVQFMLGVVVVSVGLGYAVNGILADDYAVPTLQEHAEESSVLLWAALSLLAVAFLVSVLRLGPRGFIAMLFAYGDGEGAPCETPSGDPSTHGHAHEHGDRNAER